MSGGNESALDLAARRLERAVHILEQRLAERLKTAGAEAGGLFDADRASLAAQLDEARARERDLSHRRWPEPADARGAMTLEDARHEPGRSCLLVIGRRSAAAFPSAAG